MDKGLELWHRRYLSHLKYIQERYCYQEGWIAHKFKEKYHFFPPWNLQIDPIRPPFNILKKLTPTNEVLIKQVEDAERATDSQLALNTLDLQKLSQHSKEYKKNKIKRRKEILPPKIY